jgi:hypothetical protein
MIGAGGPPYSGSSDSSNSRSASRRRASVSGSTTSSGEPDESPSIPGGQGVLLFGSEAAKGHDHAEAAHEQGQGGKDPCEEAGAPAPGHGPILLAVVGEHPFHQLIGRLPLKGPGVDGVPEGLGLGGGAHLQHEPRAIGGKELGDGLPGLGVRLVRPLHARGNLGSSGLSECTPQHHHHQEAGQHPEHGHPLDPEKWMDSSHHTKLRRSSIGPSRVR